MKLFYSPGACSIATRISLHEAGIDADYERVDLKAKLTESGDDYLAINPAGSVPMLKLDDGAGVTENVAILALIADQVPELGADVPIGQVRLLEMLSFLSTELHASFKPFFHDAGVADKSDAREAAAKRLELIAARLRGPYLFGQAFTVADAYLFAMLRWAVQFDVPMPPRMLDLFERIASRDSVRRSLEEEGLEIPLLATQT
jgi:glutathione S-transferase